MVFSAACLAEAPIEIGTRLELFVDDALVAAVRGLTFKLHEPRPADVAIRFDAPWEGNGNHYVTVFKDGDLYRMYYRCVPGRDMEASGKGWELNACYAESRDGLHFTRPTLGLIDFRGSKANNIVFSGGKGAWNEPAGNFTPFLDANPSALPAERYKATGGIGKGLYALVSPDAIHWKLKRDGPIIPQEARPKPNNLFDSQNVLFWDTVQKQYVAYLRDSYPRPGTGEMTRGVRRSTSQDFAHWSDPEWLDYGGAPATQFYTNAITPYYRAPHIYFGFPMRFLAFRNAELPKEYDPLRGKGLTDSVFMSSRDGIHWSRRFLEAFVRPGPDPLNWTDRNNTVSLGLVPTGSGEMSVYYLQHVRLPSIHMRRGVLRLDGIVSINAPYSGGELVTRPFTFSGRRLVVNYATSAAGSLRVELQDGDGKPLAGRALKDAHEMFGDSVRQAVAWDSGSDVSGWAGKPVRLRFVLKDADLYSFQFQE